MAAMKKMDKRAFTLLEEMIIVIIVGILAMIGIPNYVNSRAQAGETTCHTNLRQLNSSIQMHSIDTGLWPEDFSDLAPYLRSVPVTCPQSNAPLVLNDADGDVPAYASCPNHGNIEGFDGQDGGRDDGGDDGGNGAGDDEDDGWGGGGCGRRR